MYLLKQKVWEKRLKDREIKDQVASFYREVAEGKEQVKVESRELSRSLGYSEEELEDVPEEANMGLGCGNPQQNAEPRLGETVLDLGCGKGMDVFIAAKKVGNEGHVIGVDMTLEMIQKARMISEKRKFNNVEFRLGEIEYLPIPDNSVDLVISNCVINLSPQKDKVYNEIFRVLKPGGRIGISDITLVKPLPQEVVDDPRMYGSCVAGALTIEDKKKILEDSGFEEIELDVKKVSKEYASKWGIEFDLENYIRSTIATATK